MHFIFSSLDHLLTQNLQKPRLVYEIQPSEFSSVLDFLASTGSYDDTMIKQKLAECWTN